MSSTACIKWIKIGSPSFKPTLIVGLLLASYQVDCTNPCIASLIFLALDLDVILKYNLYEIYLFITIIFYVLTKYKNVFIKTHWHGSCLFQPKLYIPFRHPFRFGHWNGIFRYRSIPAFPFGFTANMYIYIYIFRYKLCIIWCYLSHQCDIKT